MKSAEQNISMQKWVLATAVVLFAVKILAYWLTNSVAILTDALESTVNVITGFTGLYSLRVAARPRDRNHPYGHGKIELISASFEGVLIIVAGLIIVYESLNNLLHPHPLKSLDWGMGLIAVAAAVNYLVGLQCVRLGERNRSLALVASGKHLQSDTWTTLGILAGLLLVRLTGIAWLDSATALVFAIFILYEGGKIVRESLAGITDEADEVLLREIIQFLNREKSQNWIDLHNLRIIKYGSVLHIDCHLTVPWFFNVRQAHGEVENLNLLLERNFPEMPEMFVHTDACSPPESCRICPVENCSVREAAFEKRLDWTIENLTKNLKHK